MREGRGRKPSIPAETAGEIVRLTLQETPPASTHWSTRTMAARMGVSRDTGQRIWRARGLQPHLVETFKLSNDPRLKEKLVDVVGLYLNPPDKAWCSGVSFVLCEGVASTLGRRSGSGRTRDDAGAGSGRRWPGAR